MGKESNTAIGNGRRGSLGHVTAGEGRGSPGGWSWAWNKRLPQELFSISSQTVSLLTEYGEGGREREREGGREGKREGGRERGRKREREVVIV